MDERVLQSHLSRISTIWTMVAQAQKTPLGGERDVCLALIQRYQGAVYRYLLGALHDGDAADDLFQEFAVRVLQGTFRRADPQRGRFRDYLKTTLFHLITDYQVKRRRGPQPLDAIADQPASPWDEQEAERQFIDSWCKDLLARAWSVLARAEQEAGQPYYTVLKFRADHPQASSAELAAHLNAQVGSDQSYSEMSARKLLQRARTRFADALLDEVAYGLNHPNLEELERELIDLDLLAYCRSALDRRKKLHGWTMTPSDESKPAGR